MHAETLKIYQLHPKGSSIRNGIDQSHHFHIARHVHDFCCALVAHEKSLDVECFGDLMEMPSSARLPASQVVLTVETEKYGVIVFYLCEDENWVLLYLLRGGDIIGLGAFQPGNNQMRARDEWTEEQLIVAGTYLVRTAFILSLINQPRKVVLSKEPGPRQHRKRVEVLTGKAAQAWTTVSWEIGKSSSVKPGCEVADASRRPLHWCRRYLAPAREGEPKAEMIGGRWQRWVKDCWRGHPAFGVKLQDHSPRLAGHQGGGKGNMEAILSQTKFDAMSGAQRAAFVSAGFAYSERIH